MPSRKQFESFTLTFPMQTKYIDMFEMSDVFYQHIKNVLNYVDQNKVACFETGIDNALYHIKRVDQEIRVKKQHEDGISVFSYSGMDFINWLFQIAPFVGMVGISNGDF